MAVSLAPAAQIVHSRLPENAAPLRWGVVAARGALPGNFQQASALRFLGTRNRAAADQVARAERTAGAMGDHLRERPVKRGKTPAADPYGLVIRAERSQTSSTML